MTIIEKQKLIKQNKEGAISALNAYLDSIYDLTDQYFDEEGNLLPYLSKDEKLESFVKDLRERSKEYESVRAKIIQDDFSLSLPEINLVGLSFLFVVIRGGNIIKKLQKSQQESKRIFECLVEGSEKDKFLSENFDFSNRE